MNKKYIIKQNEIINKIIEKDNKKLSNNFVIYYVSNNLNYNRYCITIGKKLCKANKRNYIKRVIKDILMKNNINNSMDCVIMVRKSVLDMKYIEIQESLLKEIEEIK